MPEVNYYSPVLLVISNEKKGHIKREKRLKKLKSMEALKEFFEKIGITRDYISKLESSRKKPSQQLILQPRAKTGFSISTVSRSILSGERKE